MTQHLIKKPEKKEWVKKFTPTLAVNDLFDTDGNDDCLSVKVLSDHSYAIDGVTNVTEM